MFWPRRPGRRERKKERRFPLPLLLSRAAKPRKCGGAEVPGCVGCCPAAMTRSLAVDVLLRGVLKCCGGGCLEQRDATDLFVSLGAVLAWTAPRLWAEKYRAETAFAPLRACSGLQIAQFRALSAAALSPQPPPAQQQQLLQAAERLLCRFLVPRPRPKRGVAGSSDELRAAALSVCTAAG